MSKYRTNFVKGRNGQTVYAVEVYQPEVNDWGVVKVFHTKTKAEEYKQTLEAYGKENKK
jgi:hypothetical protein